MPIPVTDRVIYRKPMLEEVICQLRFPTILKITSDAPADFQDSIRDEFPIFEQQYSSPPAGLPPELLSLIERATSPSQRKAYNFFSADKNWKLGLADNFLALSTKDYKRWEEFRDLLEPAAQALVANYRPSFFDRIGLRYKNSIIPSKLGLNDVPWSDLLEPHIIGALGIHDVSAEIKSTQTEILLALGEDVGEVKVRHHLEQSEDLEESCYVIDADFFYENRTGSNDAITKLSELNSYAGRLFRWCITDRLYEAMEPESIKCD